MHFHKCRKRGKEIKKSKKLTKYLVNSEIIRTFASAIQKWRAKHLKNATGEVAELVDALLWGGTVNCDVGVRVSSSSLAQQGD